MIFHQKLTTNDPHSTPLLAIAVIPAVNNSVIPALSENWAAQKTKSTVRFTNKQKHFLEAKFNQGVETGSEYICRSRLGNSVEIGIDRNMKILSISMVLFYKKI